MIAFIDEYRDRFSVEFICKTLNEQRQGGFITSRGYRNAKYGTPSARSIRDRELVAKVLQIHGENYGVYGVRKMWHALSRCGLAVGREQTARLMRLAGVSGKGKGRSPITTRKPGGKIPGQIWFIASFTPRVRIGCGSRTLLMFEPLKGSFIRRL